MTDDFFVAGALQQRNLRLLWGGQFVSDFGRQLTISAFPTIAILGLHARAETVTALTGSEYAVIPLFAMLAGLLIDRWRRRHTMVIANLVRLTVLGAVALLAASRGKKPMCSFSTTTISVLPYAA